MNDSPTRLALKRLTSREDDYDIDDAPFEEPYISLHLSEAETDDYGRTKSTAWLKRGLKAALRDSRQVDPTIRDRIGYLKFMPLTKGRRGQRGESRGGRAEEKQLCLAVEVHKLRAGRMSLSGAVTQLSAEFPVSPQSVIAAWYRFKDTTDLRAQLAMNDFN